MFRRLALLAALAVAPGLAFAAQPFVFPSIDGGTLSLGDYAGQPVLVVNTASFCAFTPQYEALQALQDAYEDRGLVVLAVPSDDFGQEKDSAAEVAEFCELTFGLDLPMTDITHVKGPEAHAFYRWLREEIGFVPRWNFNKVLLDGDGAVTGTWGSRTDPAGPQITGAIDALLTR